MKQHIVVESEKEKQILADLQGRKDIKAERIKKLLVLPDLTKKVGSPIKILADSVINLPRFVDFDTIELPRIVSNEDEFESLNFPKDHPARKETDTFYVDKDNHLRTQMTIMWPFYLRHKGIKEKLSNEGSVALIAPGIVFRKDEIDSKHFPAFHQIDFLYICKKAQKVITLQDLQDVQADAVKAIFGNIEFRFLTDTFPFTDPSTQVEINWKGSWMEITGAGLVHSRVLRYFGLDPEVYNGWAFAFGIERLAMIKMEIPDIRIFWSTDSRITGQFKDINSKYKEVSKYPDIVRDISFIINKSVALNNYYELVRDEAGDLVEQVEKTDEYENDEKFGTDKRSYTFRIVYRSLERTLTNQEINIIHDKISEKTKQEFGATIR